MGREKQKGQGSNSDVILDSLNTKGSIFKQLNSVICTFTCCSFKEKKKEKPLIEGAVTVVKIKKKSETIRSLILRKKGEKTCPA